MESKLNDILCQLAKAGRSSSWSKEHKLTSTRDGLLSGTEYCVTIFHRNSCRVDTQFIDRSLKKIVIDIERFISDKHLEWVLTNESEPF